MLGLAVVTLGLVLRARRRRLDDGVEHLPPGLLDLLRRPADALFKSLGCEPDLNLLLWELCDHGQVAELSFCGVREFAEGGLQEGGGVHGGTVGGDAAQRNHHLGEENMKTRADEFKMKCYFISLQQCHAKYKRKTITLGRFLEEEEEDVEETFEETVIGVVC